MEDKTKQQIQEALNLLGESRVSTESVPSAEEYFRKNYRIDKVEIEDLQASFIKIMESFANLYVEQRDETIKLVLRDAVSAIYFNDNADYLRVLYSIVRTITKIEGNIDIKELYKNQKF